MLCAVPSALGERENSREPDKTINTGADRAPGMVQKGRAMINPQRSISEEIIDLIEWFGGDDASEYKSGILTGLRMAEQLAEAVERNSEVSVHD